MSTVKVIIQRILTSKTWRRRYLLATIIGKKMTDSLYLKIYYKTMTNKKLDIENPISFNEKLQWLKLYDHNPLYTTLVDKYAVREYIKEKIGKEYLIPLVGGPWKSFGEISFDTLPNQFVLKTTHDSGGVVVCRNKEKFDINTTKKILEKSLRKNYYYGGREWPYKNVQPQIIAEKYMSDSDRDELTDYKLMCFNGKHKCTFICEDRFSKDGLKVTFYDKDWNIMPFERHYPRNSVKKDKPITYDKMVELAETLSQGIPFVRVDFYEIQGKIYFGELTFYPGSGFEEFNPPEWDRILGDWLVLPEKKK